MRKINIFTYILVVIVLQLFCAKLWSAEDRIDPLQKQILALESQKSKLESQKKELATKGDELSYKIESLKMQSRTGLGIIGRYKLSRALREAQSLSEKVQALEKDIYDVDNKLKDKRKELEKEYESQIAMLIDSLDKSKSAIQRRQILEKLNKYRTEKEKLAQNNKQQLEYLDVEKIEIKEYDSPQDIREKADLIKDYTTRLNNGIKSLSNKIEKLKTERKTRIKLGEFADEISFFGERVSKEEILADSNAKVAADKSGELVETKTPLESDTLSRANDSEVKQPVADTPIAVDRQPETSGRMVIERNGVSADFMGAPLDQIEKEIKLLEKRKQELEKEKATLSEKAISFYRKANEIEKTETKAGAKKR